ncbi:RuBisCO large subunit C-terminal-like domain-containing protein [Sporohalobacter salinus]|uniref:RuBisCO large subunit C-terminal-like domain-containing protein n=1 Tax=Sporohalobacter salinus TaxID=1494606 RepID=UPI001960CB3E|nr:RuBisCO large subunit C-terminal-like domain-containing protein [Sporohalobacter salinus]MBM7623375.1 2,3-diketo-5-methylthiopentyl-1-phosphate enolase [Sporohalobacter salinus]
MNKKEVFSLTEEVNSKDYVIATYYIELPVEEDIVNKASSFAEGQTIGTWLPVAGINNEMREKHMGKVVNIFDIPPYELSTQVNTEYRYYLIQLAFPTINFESQFPMFLTTLLGNDASTSAQVKLVDLQLPESFIGGFNGPNFGIEGVRELVGVKKRPLILNMIKPCTGLDPETGAQIFYKTALGGVDLIKDDELLGNPSFNRVSERVKAYKKAAERAYEETGKKTLYVVNVTDRADKILENARKAVELGVSAIMVNFATVGYSLLHTLAQEINIPIIGHYAGVGTYCEGVKSGMSSPLAVGKLARLAGADIVVINTPYGNYPLRHQKYIKTINFLTLPFYQVKSVFPAVGGGVHPGMVKKFISDFGRDIVLAVGGAIHGHPEGATSGSKAMRQAVGAVMNDISLKEAAQQNKELRIALKHWGISD